MYCRNCGKEIDENAVVCIHCGCLVANVKMPSTYSSGSKKALGALFFLLLGLIGLIIGLCIYPKETIERESFIEGWFAGLSVIMILGIFIVVGVMAGVML